MTNDCSVDIISCNKPSSVSNLITTNQAHNDVDNDDDTHSLATPRKQDHITPEICDTNNTTDPFNPNVHYRLFQHSPSLQQHH